MTTIPQRVLVMGGGPAGLASGHYLIKSGFEVQVLEKDQMVGGLARTEVRDGFRFDIGGHRWFTKKDELNQFLVNLMADELILVNRISRIFFDDKYIDYPIRLKNVLKRVGPVVGTRAVGDFLVSSAKKKFNPKANISMEDAYVDQFGRTLYEMFFKNYSEKVWGRNPNNLSSDWVNQRTKGLSLLTAIKDSVVHKDGKMESLVERFMYPAHGFGRISERMAEDINNHDQGNIELEAFIVEVGHRNERIETVTWQRNGHTYVEAADQFISSIPMTELLRILRPAAPSHLVEAAAQLSYRDIVTVNLMFKRERISLDTWVYVHDTNIKFARFHEPKNWSEAMVPPGYTSVVCEYFCNQGDEIWEMSEANLCELTLHYMADILHFVEKNEVCGGFAIHCKDAYPTYTIGYKERVEAIKDYLNSFSNLQIVGRGGTFRYNNSDHSIETGMLAAKNLLGEKHNLDLVNSSDEYLEERKVKNGRSK